ncbi:cytochrome c family protein [uncultured Jannaschia sp.]|uniref:c-type cytochrome n=1 Tax=uncultured Jannaschia sp. TaxID=293347 RepID=UPI003426BB7F
MTMTKIVGAGCGALLVFLLGAWAGEAIYHVGVESHGDEEHAEGYAIEVASAEDAGGSGEPDVPFEEVYATASAEAGEGLWRQCASCHAVDGTNKTGPYLNGVVGREHGSVEGYAYSDAIASIEGPWTPEEISRFIENPKEYAPGTKMSYRGMDDVEDRANLIAYLESQS